MGRPRAFLSPIHVSPDSALENEGVIGDSANAILGASEEHRSDLANSGDTLFRISMHCAAASCISLIVAPAMATQEKKYTGCCATHSL